MNGVSGRTRYRDSRFRLLIDMHIPDWDERFLARYDPADMANAVRDAGADGAMLYFQSHVGLCYWPTRSGVRHRAARDRDLAGEALAGLHAAGIPVCAYYSVNFNNRAWVDHPDWRLKPAASATIGILPRERYGIVCLNNAGYRAFVDEQVAEITDYPVDAYFFDMMWWNGVCLCDSCRARHRAEEGAEIPEIIDWAAPAWTRFQAARERWLTEFAVALRTKVKELKPEADVYHNFALGLSNWTRGVSFASVAGHDFLGGDFYGGRAEQSLVTRLMLNLSPSRPPEFMTTVAAGLTEHSRLRSASEIATKALAATTSGAAFLAIGAIDPDGAIDREAITRIAEGFAAAEVFRPFTGGDPVEDIGVYCSDLSRMSFAQDGFPITDAPAASAPDYPHFDALSGACRILQQAHLPFGVLTAGNLGTLDRWPVIVLPHVLRMSTDELAAFRAYVERGGRLYASRGTSLAGVQGGPQADFALADLFGCHFDGEEEGRLVYAVTGARWPELARPISHWRGEGGRVGAMRLRPGAGEVLVRLGLPYGYPSSGRVEDTNWASIHSSPLWEVTDRPLVVRHRAGAGEVIYSAIDIEAGGSADHDALFVSLIRALLPDAPRMEVETHGSVWASAFDQPDKERMILCLLAYPLEHPALPVPSARVRLRLPPGMACTAVRAAPGLEPIAHRAEADGQIAFEAGPFDRFALSVVEYRPA